MGNKERSQGAHGCGGMWRTLGCTRAWGEIGGTGGAKGNGKKYVGIRVTVGVGRNRGYWGACGHAEMGEPGAEVHGERLEGARVARCMGVIGVRGCHWGEIKGVPRGMGRDGGYSEPVSMGERGQQVPVGLGRWGALGYVRVGSADACRQSRGLGGSRVPVLTGTGWWVPVLTAPACGCHSYPGR